MTKIYVRESNGAPRSAHRHAPRPQPGNSGNSEGQPRHGEAKPPSYLAEVKADLLSLVAPEANDRGEAREFLAQAVWPFVSEKLRQSYWNGVRGGASGKVKPKAPRGGATTEGA